MNWWGPKDFTAPVIDIDFKVGGRYLFCMRGRAGPGQAVKDFWNTGEFVEIAPMEKIVLAMSFADEQGNAVPASHYGMPGQWPDKVMVTATFEKVAEGKTKVSVQEVGVPSVMSLLTRMGWEQSFDKMAEALATAGQQGG